MNATIAGVLDYSIQIIGFAILIFVPFSKRRARADWAKRLFIAGSAIGVARGLVGLAWDLRYFSFGSTGSQAFIAYNSMIGGLLLGFLIALAVSGQLLGKKQLPNPTL